MDHLEAARQMIGPRGGLPNLKGDLVRLATLLHVSLNGDETVEKIKGKIRPSLALLKASTPPESANAKAKSTPATSSAPVVPVPVISKSSYDVYTVGHDRGGAAHDEHDAATGAQDAAHDGAGLQSPLPGQPGDPRRGHGGRVGCGLPRAQSESTRPGRLRAKPFP